MFASDGIGAPVFVHARRPRDGRGRMPRARNVLPPPHARRRPRDDPDARPHAGATAFLWDTGEHRVLFTGDTIYLDEGEWVEALLESSDRAAYIESLELMRELDFDVLVPGRRAPEGRSTR